ncbi:MAG: hypothetical protein H7A36_07135 [Chlamydiales bacterium]|nr:hypothetical protein [Chlamydiales bacterium]
MTIYRFESVRHYQDEHQAEVNLCSLPENSYRLVVVDKSPHAIAYRVNRTVVKMMDLTPGPSELKGPISLREGSALPTPKYFFGWNAKTIRLMTSSDENGVGVQDWITNFNSDAPTVYKACDVAKVIQENTQLPVNEVISSYQRAS